ncbi:alpha/beta hydrolase family protein [Ramlibacter sp. PS4R-6]|uniref:alpha/beta hydrolase family protein n=1 Tax=Ramlibacter sp. PS4R-6 TaxID=3133438 RepID=UPI0030A7FC1A
MLRAVAFLFLAVATSAWGQSFDPITTDPPAGDPQFAAQPALLSVQSGGVTLNGRGLIAQGKGPHPTVLLLHGFPGNELNLDLAQAMRRAGWNVFMFHYRGNWGSGGQYSFPNVLEDTATVLAHLRTRANPAWRVDPGRIVLVGHSVGGFAALNTAAADAGVKSVASIAGFDVSLNGESLAANAAMRDGFTNFVKAQGSINVPDAEGFIKAWTTAPASWKFPGLASKLATKNVLMVMGSRDTVSTPAIHHAPLLQALRATPGAQVAEVVLETDHNFSDKRIALQRAILEWLSKQ